MDSNGNENETQVGSTTTCGSERKDPGWKYARLPNEKDLNTIICIFCDKVTKGGYIDTNILLVDIETPKNVRNARFMLDKRWKII